MPFDFGDESLNPGDSTAINCMITKGDSPLEIQWKFNSRPIERDNSMGIIITKLSPRLSSLSIESVSARHRGVYQCTAINKAGETEHSSSLKVNGDYSENIRKLV